MKTYLKIIVRLTLVLCVYACKSLTTYQTQSIEPYSKSIHDTENNGRYMIFAWQNTNLPTDETALILLNTLSKNTHGFYKDISRPELKGRLTWDSLRTAFSDLNSKVSEFKRKYPGELTSAIISIDTHGFEYGGKHYLRLNNSPSANSAIQCLKSGNTESACNVFSSRSLLNAISETQLDEIIFFTISCFSGKITQNFSDWKFWEQLPDSARLRNFRLAVFTPVKNYETNREGRYPEAVEAALNDMSGSRNGDFLTYGEFKATLQFHLLSHYMRHAGSGFMPHYLQVYETPNFQQHQPFILTNQGFQKWAKGSLVFSRQDQPAYPGNKVGYWADMSSLAGKGKACGGDSICILQDQGKAGFFSGIFGNQGPLWTGRSPGYPDDQAQGGDYKTFSEAKKACADLVVGSYRNWRIPTTQDIEKWDIEKSLQYNDLGMRTIDQYYQAFGNNDDIFWVQSELDSELSDPRNFRNSIPLILLTMNGIVDAQYQKMHEINQYARYTWRCVHD